jgi:8-oxo-dGTP pyrophosphatase MutT (NUDIX family)
MPDDPIRAAGILIRSRSGTVLLLRRSTGEDHAGTWALPGGKLRDGEDPADAACRETLEELGWDPGSAGKLLCRRISEGVDYTTFLKDVDHEFAPPKMNGEHDGWMWVAPTEALAEHRALANAVDQHPLLTPTSRHP